MIRVSFVDVCKSYQMQSLLGLKESLFNFFSGRKKEVKEYLVLKNVSFNIYDKEIVGIVGRNGAGKSTLLSMIAGVIKPDSGKINITGRIAPLLELGAGFHPELTGRENIILNGLILGLSKKQIVMAMSDIINFSGISEFIDQPIRTYSSGMIARLGFSVAIQTNPNILLIDEVLSVGDSDFQRKSMDKIFEFKRKGTTIIFVSHDHNAVKMLCDKVIWVEGHQVKMIGSTEDVMKEFECA